MPRDRNKNFGREVAYLYSLSQDRKTVPSDYVTLGAMRDKEFGSTADTVDFTADSSGQYREKRISYKNFDPSGSVVIDNTDAANQKQLESHIMNDPDSCGWLRIIRPLGPNLNRVYDVFVAFTGIPITATYDDAMTAALSCENSGGFVHLDDVTI